MASVYGRANMLIGGRWVPSSQNSFLRTMNPATGEVVAEVPEGTGEDVHLAVAAARGAQPGLAAMTLWERSALLHAVADRLEERKEELATVASRETGKPLYAEALGEVGAAIQGFRNAAELVKWLEGTVVPAEDPNKRVFSSYVPRGVYAVITPFNFPVNIPVEYIAPAIAAGNAVVWIPALGTAYTGIMLAEIIQSADVPEGVLNVVTGDGAVVGNELVAHPDVQGIGFTGSTETGFSILKRGWGKAHLMELGGNGPTIILEDADLDHAVDAVFLGCFVNAGQTCAAAERILIHSSVQEAFAAKLRDKVMSEVRLGDPADRNTTMGPLHKESIAAKMDAHVADALKKDAVLTCGGVRARGFPTDLFYEPTILTGCARSSLVNLEETFGPIAPCIPFDTHEEALEIAAQSNYGLLASVFTQSAKSAFFFTERLRSGIVTINEHSNYWELHIPFGGASGTKSGLGRVGGKHALLAMSDIKTMIWDISH
ncbi:MAG: aldehyde dehydrogenase family protein [Spirochaetales bacterium]|nr:aldehyde dehydrogenase family protein [Spirochaetales bacterium]